MEIETAKLRQFLTSHFDSDEIVAFCFDHFPDVYDQFGQGMTKGQQIQQLLTYCRNYNKNDDLLAALRQERRHAYEDQLAPDPIYSPAPVSKETVQRNPRQIFFSYAHQDEPLARRIAYDLRQDGWQVWAAFDKIGSSQDWAEAINSALEQSGVFLLLLTQYAVQSHWVKKETNYALDQAHQGYMRFFPLKAQTRVNIPPLWGSLQYLPFTGRGEYQSNLDRLLAELVQSPYTPPPPELPVWQKVGEWSKYVPKAVWLSLAAFVVLTILITQIDWSVFSVPPEPTEESMIVPTGELTATPTPTLQASDTPASTNAPQLGDTRKREQDGMTMVFVPGGTFTMGSSEAEIDAAFELCEQYRGEGACQRSWFEDETPAHEVQVGDYLLDQYEVTNSQFVLLLNEEGNQEEGGVTWLEIDSGNVLIEEVGGVFRPKERFDAHPVIEVSWYGANAYCQKVGGQLPTEAQWEFAARGSKINIFPWGDEFDGTQLNYCDTNCEFDWKDETVDDGFARTAPVGSYAGDSWVDVQDMAGNVWEWTADWYDSTYYSNAPENNPTGPTTGNTKVLRGGSWDNVPSYVRGSNRLDDTPDNRFDDVGFRCVVLPGN